MNKYIKTSVSIDSFIFIAFGSLYYLIEILYRGYSHYSMFILGGLCGLLIGKINEYTPKMNIFLQSLLGCIIITLSEFILGMVLNLWLGLNVWDYSNLKYNLCGQICLQFSLCWYALSFPIVWIDDILRLKYIKSKES